MTAVVFRDGTLVLDEVQRPTPLTETDAIVKVTTTAICGSDLHILHGRVPGMREGSVVGHEVVGEIVDLGDAVAGLEVGQRVVASCMVPCGACPACARSDYGRCPTHKVLGYGQLTGDLDGAQAEYVRVPNAGLALKGLSAHAALLTDQVLLPVGDVLTTALDAVESAGIKPGDSVVVSGLGPVGQYAVQLAALRSPAQVIAVDPVASRRDLACRHGATHGLAPDDRTHPTVLELTSGIGADVVIDCAGVLPALDLGLFLLRPGGRMAVIGLYTEMEWTTPLGIHFARGIEIKFCGTANIVGRWDAALGMLVDGAVNPMIESTVTLPLEKALDGYAAVASGEVLKVQLTPDGSSWPPSPPRENPMSDRPSRG